LHTATIYHQPQAAQPAGAWIDRASGLRADSCCRRRAPLPPLPFSAPDTQMDRDDASEELMMPRSASKTLAMDIQRM
jgi:hypothetical protein